MIILIINCGSSSLKYDLINVQEGEKLAGGLVENIGQKDSAHTFMKDVQTVKEVKEVKDHLAAVRLALNNLVAKDNPVLSNLEEIQAVGHRVVHGGEKMTSSRVITPEVKEQIKKCIDLAPLHNPINLAGIDACQELMPNIPHVAVFDTAFHSSMPARAYVYGIPYNLYRDHGFRRYGFHGTSHAYVANKAAEYLGKEMNELNIISCHLGNGASICAIEKGRSIDTSMGLTPLEGLIMGTRCGDIDPALVLVLQKQLGLSIDETDKLLNKQSGLTGISGLSNDIRQVMEEANNGNYQALLAIQIFCYRLKKYIGAYAAVLGHLDILIFTGGIGENSKGIRARTCQGLDLMGVALDEMKNIFRNPNNSGIFEIHSDSSKTKVLVVKTREDLMIARETATRVGYQQASEDRVQEEFKVPIITADQHIHLCQEDLEKLFGQGYTLTKTRDISQPGQFVAEETLTLIGPRDMIPHVRIIGPVREKTQVEITRTEECRLGIDAPLRLSGELDNTPGIVLEGNEDRIKMEKGVICPLRHIHMTSEDAKKYSLCNQDVVRIKIPGEREVIFGGVHVRVSDKAKLAMHLDTDEANAAELDTNAFGLLDGVQERK